MTESMYGWCSSSTNHLHQRKAIGYEKTQDGPEYESRGKNLVLTKGASFRYFVVWVCESCAMTWWMEDRPNLVEVAS